MNRKEIGIIIVLLLIGGIGVVYNNIMYSEGSYISVTVEGKETAVYSLNKEDEIILVGKNGSSNHLVIRNGAAFISEADCDNQICVSHKAVSKEGESIVCLPNEVVVTVIDKKEEAKKEVDVIAK